jgi:hypothetical protein
MQNYMVQWKTGVQDSLSEGTTIDALAFADVGKDLSQVYNQAIVELGVHCQQIYGTFGSVVGALRETVATYGRAEAANAGE